MDVLHVIHQFPPETRGGSECYVRDIAVLQQRRGVEVEVLAGSLAARGNVCVDEEEVDGLRVHRLHRNDLFFDHHVKAWHPGVTRAFDELLERRQPALVHLHHWVRLSNDLIQTAHARKIPCVVTLHDYYTSCPRAFRARADNPACERVLGGASCWECVPKYGHESEGELQEGVELFAASYRRELALAHKVLVTVGTTGDLLSRTTGLPRERYDVLPLGYHRRFEGAPALPAPPAGGPLRFAFWGGVGRHKGVHVLVAAFCQLGHTHPGSELHVLGGFETPEYERELRAAAQGAAVTFHGPFEPAQVLACAPHCGVFPSTCIETFGLVLDECFELGLPCIISDLGALPERAAGAGLCVPAGDVDALAVAMQRVCSEPQLWQRLRESIPPPPPDLAQHADRLESVYQQALSSPAPEPCAPEVPLARRLHFLQVQRDSALTQLIPPGGPA